jgi:RimJ/RimL family protein N-acetyltransferase
MCSLVYRTYAGSIRSQDVITLEKEFTLGPIPTFQTRRLILTPLELTDAPAIQRLFPHWEVVRYLDSRVPWPYPDDGALTYVRDQALPAIAAGREWHWMIRITEGPAQCIGSISLYDQPGNNRGFWLAPQWQGKGYMREACEAINAYWFEALERPVMRVPKAVGNLDAAGGFCLWVVAQGGLGDDA